MKPLQTAAALALALQATALGATEPAMKTRQPYPPVQPAKEVHFPGFVQKTLPNGLRVVVVEHREAPVVTVQMLFRAGKAFEPADKAGLADATASLLRDGTASRSSQQIAGAIDAIGGSLTTQGSLDSAYAAVGVTSDQLDLGLDLLADVVLRPSFPAEELERWRRQALNNLRVQQDDAGYLADATFDRAVFHGHPYGLPDGGTPASVGAITRDDLIAFHREYFVPNEAIVAVIGDVAADDAYARIERAFGAWPRGKEHAIPPVDAAGGDKPRILVIDVPDAVQSELRIGQVGLAFADPDSSVADVFNSILGGGPSSRLYQEVRTKRGLTYGAGSSFLKAVQPGTFQASTFTKTESTVQVLEVMLDVVRELAKNPVPTAELEARKTYLSGVFPLEIETAEGIAGKVLEAMKYGLGREHIEGYRGRIDAVTAAQVQSFAERRIRPGSFLIVLAGNAKGFLPELEKKQIGPIEVIPAAELDLLRADLRKPAAPAPAAP